MKYIKYLISYKTILSLIVLLFVLISCKKDMKDLNMDKKLITDKMLEQDANEGGFALPGMQLSIIDVRPWVYEDEQMSVGNDYGGYMNYPQPWFDNKSNMTYVMVDSYNSDIWASTSSRVLDQWVAMEKKGFKTKYPDLYAMSLIFKVFAAHRLVDMFGPVPYSLYGTSSDVKFDSEEEAYNLFFAELKSAVAALKAAEAINPSVGQIRYAKFDKSRYGGDYAKWIKVANTLRLRLAIRISNVDPAKAQSEGEAAINDGGVLEDADGSFEVTSGTVHPLVTITRDWGEARLNAAVETILGGFNDPRLPKYALPATDPALGGLIKGIRSGLVFNGKSYAGFSEVNFLDNPFVKIMDVAESYFLRAEGALRGWDMGGTAKDFYEKGIRTSFNSNKVGGVEDYINDNTSTPLPYTDPNNSINDAPPIISVKIKWDESASFEEKLERIITQKWIAMYPEGQEAWSEFRRTGYPRLWPVVVNFSGGEVPDGKFIKRLTYPSAIINSSQSAAAEAVSKYLGGQDKMFTRIWWDIK